MPQGQKQTLEYSLGLKVTSVQNVYSSLTVRCIVEAF